MKYRSTLCDLFSNKAEQSGKLSSCSIKGIHLFFYGKILIKELDVFLKTALPQAVQGNVFNSRLRSVLKYSIVALSVKVHQAHHSHAYCHLAWHPVASSD